MELCPPISSEKRHTEHARQASALARVARKAAQAQSVQELEGGAKVYLDSPPGIGFVLEFPNGRKKYYVTSEQAKEFWTVHYRKDFGIA